MYLSVFGFFHLTIMFSRFIGVVACISISFLFIEKQILLYGSITFCLSICQLIDI